MKEREFSKDDGSRPEYDLKHCVEHALDLLFRDKTNSFSDQVVPGLSYEELIGTLLLAKDAAVETRRPED